jgi:hypothetical protein
MKNAVFGVFLTREELDRAVESLARAGVSTEAISILEPDGHAGSAEFPYQQDNHIPEGAKVGALVGLFFFGILGVVAAIQGVTIPFGDSMNGLNPLWGGLLGAVFGGAFGAAAGALIGVGTPHSAPDRYAGYVNDGGFLLSVHEEVPERASEVMRLMEEAGAVDPTTSADEDASWRWVFSHSRVKKRRFRPKPRRA